jgi:ABC-type uncharacterized transport system involved in gliding motility auxiliary subunit
MSFLAKLFNRRTVPAFALPLLALVFVALIALSSYALRGVRLDLTEHKLYTLSDGTRHILDRNKEPVKLRLFYSEKTAQNLPQFRVYAQRVRELLEEIVARSHGKISLEVIDPEPFSDAEDKAASYGLQAIPLNNTGDTLYFGLVGTNSTDGQTAMPFIQPDKETFLEYDLAKLISTLTLDKKPVLAVLSGLPTGPGSDPVTGQPSLGWVVDRQLSELFEMRRLQANPSSIGDDVDLLMLIHPKNLSDSTLYAIDQFVLRGGHLLAFVDPLGESDPAAHLVDPSQMEQGTVYSDLPRLFKSWGIVYDPTKVVLDSQNAMQVQPNPNQPPVRHLAILGLHKASLNQKDVVSADLENLNFSTAGAISLDSHSPLTLEALAQSSSASQLVDAEAVQAASNDPGALATTFKPDAKAPYVLAARFTGRLKTAFPERTDAGRLLASRAPANIMVVADTDILSDRMWVQISDFLGQQNFNPFANNGDFVYNAVDNMVGNSDLIAVRTRATSTRPFERVEVIRRAAEKRYQAKAKQLQQQLDALEQKLNQLQPTTPGADVKTLSREQQAELLRFQQEKLATRKSLRDVQHQLNADIDALGVRLKVINMLAMPLLVVLVAAFIGWRRWARRRAAVR